MKKTQKKKKAYTPKIEKTSSNAERSPSLADKINFVSTILTFASVIIAIITIAEMRVERTMAYKPSVLINPVEAEFSWDTDGFEEWVEKSESTVTANGGTIRMPITLFTGGSISKLPIANIGVGTAKNLEFTWHESNTNNLIDHLVSLDESKEDFCLVDRSIAFSYGDHVVVMDKELPTVLMYLLPNASEIQPLDVPTHYTLLINEIVKSGKYNNDIILFLYVEYDDIQGKHTKDIVAIQVKKTFFKQEADGSGYAKYQLIPNVLD